MPLTFTKAIEEVTGGAEAEAALAYLRKHSPEIAELLAKDLTASDVHATTALGNEGKKKKSKFKEMLSTVGETNAGTKVSLRDTEWEMPLKITKTDPDQQLIFGWASISEVGGQLVVDKQDDIILPDDLEKAAYDFVLYSRDQGDMHVMKGVGRLVESMMFTKQKQDLLGIDLGLQGWWVGFKVDSDDVWAAHKRGERPEFSIGGRGQRVEIE